MKKAFVTFSVIMLAVVSAFAQGDQVSNRYLNTKFSQNWFIDLSGSLNAWQGSDRSSLIEFNSMYFKNTNGGLNFGGSLKVGKYVSPVVGLRVGLDMNQMTNRLGDYVLETAHADVMFSLADLFAGFREDRVYRPVLFVGTGVVGKGHKFFQVNDLNHEFCVMGGLINNFRLGKSIDLHLDLQATTTRWSIESETMTPDPRHAHFNFAALLGLNWNIGGRQFDACEAAPVVADCSEKDARIKNLEEQLNELMNRPVTPTKPDTVVKFVNVEGEGQLISTPFSIFFNKGSYEITSKRDLVNLGEMVKAAKAGDYRIRLRGTCDSATGSKEVNMRLAENRCRRVKEELVKLGFAESNIVVDAAGGVSELAPPAELDRRVFVELIK